MVDYIDEDDELEKFKRWWAETGQNLLLAVLVVVSGYFGWEFWQNKQTEKAEQGFLVYQQMLDAVAEVVEGGSTQAARDTVTHHAVTLKEDYAGSQYAHYASLILAKQAYEQGDAERAESELRGVMDSADENLASVARLRLARIVAETNTPDAGLALLTSSVPAYTSLYAEARGDFYWMKGDLQSAADQYRLALDSLAEEERQFSNMLETKLNQVTVWKTPDTETEENS